MNQSTKKKIKVFDGRYEILSIVGRGSGSVVYKARHLSAPHDEVALKVLILNSAKGESSERLRHEALALVSARHKYIIRLDDFHSVDNLCYLSMEYAPNSDLGTYAKKNGGKLSPLQAERFFRQTLEALSYVHSIGMYHRDIKPSNILVINDRYIRLADFGVALLPGAEASSADLQSGVGTTSYMAPEIFEAKKFTPQTDLYLTAASFYELLSGVQPFDGKPMAQILECRKDGAFKTLKELNPEVPDYLNYVIMKALSFEVKNRFASANDILDILEAKSIPLEQTTILEEKVAGSGEITVDYSSGAKKEEPLVQNNDDAINDMAINNVKAKKVDNAEQIFSEINEAKNTKPFKADQVQETNLESKSYQATPEVSKFAPVKTQLIQRPMEQVASAVKENLDEAPRNYDLSKSTAKNNIQEALNRKAPAKTLGKKPLIIGLALLSLAAYRLFFYGNDVPTYSKNNVLNSSSQQVNKSNEINKVVDFSFPQLPSGLYAGQIDDLILDQSTPLTIISHRGANEISIILGLEGWTPSLINIEEVEEKVIVKSNGFVLEMGAERVGNSLEGWFKNILTGEEGKWIVRIQ